MRDAAWWWGRMVGPLAEHGIASVAVPLPSCGETGPDAGDLYDDVEACRRAIASAADGPVVLLGHSYGGMVITGAGADDRVAGLIYLTSVMPDTGESQAGMIGNEPAPWVVPGDGVIEVRPDLVRRLHLQDCDEGTIEGALARLTPQPILPFTQAPREIAWHVTPATYVVCTDDLATPAEVQRARVREGARLVEFAAGHHPFLSRPHDFATLLAAEVGRVD